MWDTSGSRRIDPCLVPTRNRHQIDAKERLGHRFATSKKLVGDRCRSVRVGIGFDGSQRAVALAVCGLHMLAFRQKLSLACNRGRTDFGEFRFGSQLCEEWVSVYRRVGAMIRLDRQREQPESSTCLAAVCEVCSKRIIQFGICLWQHGCGQRGNFFRRPVGRAGLQHSKAFPSWNVGLASGRRWTRAVAS